MKSIRNFVIISQVDHGKSTLADRFLELTNTVPKEKMRPQYLDGMDLERERGITIKMQSVRMEYKGYILNLIDTPGHVDFSYEVLRSLAAVEGAILLVDATKGIQAQTIRNLELAKKQNLAIIPVINKIDLPNARIDQIQREISDLLQVNLSEILKISAKYGTNIDQVLETIIKKIPPPKCPSTKELRALIFDFKYDPYKGVVAFVRIFDSEIRKGERIYLIQTEIDGEAKEVGIFRPELTPTGELKSGEIGYIATGVKEPRKVRVGDTITSEKPTCNALRDGAVGWSKEISLVPGYEEPQPMVFLDIYPENSDYFESLKVALERLKLNDAALIFKPELKEGLGRGFQCGFLGLLHAEIITERLKREFGLELILSPPNLTYKVITRDNQSLLVRTPADWPDSSRIIKAQELWIKLRILTPLNYLGPILELLENNKPYHLKTDYLGEEKLRLIYELPLREIINKNFYDRLKSISQGFASMDYKVLNWRDSNLVKLDVLILGREEKNLSKIVPEKDAFSEGKKIVERLKEILPPQLFAIPLQAAVRGKIIAREIIKAKRRDITAPLYGGDYTRKRKLLEKQKRGKKELKEKSRLRIPAKVFLEMFKA